MKNDFAYRVGVVLATFLVIAFLGILTLHLGLRLSWAALAAPFLSFATLQIGCFAAVFYVGKHKNVRAGLAVSGLYCLLLGVIVIHYGSRLGLLGGEGDIDAWAFALCIAFITTAGTIFMPRHWRSKLESWLGEVKCARCRHYHEGRDCTCGCRAEQFRYPPFSGP